MERRSARNNSDQGDLVNTLIYAGVATAALGGIYYVYNKTKPADKHEGATEPQAQDESEGATEDKSKPKFEKLTIKKIYYIIKMDKRSQEFTLGFKRALTSDIVGCRKCNFVSLIQANPILEDIYINIQKLEQNTCVVPD